MLGIRPGFDTLTVDPCIPADWDGFEAVRRWRGAEYRITVRNPGHVEKGVRSIRVDGVEVADIPAFESGTHQVEIEMGGAAV